ncbi:MAG TPA: hypothetical protein VFD32_05280 [Dehalococcoidia bacterium]|nr:hypothetical protein [Dehalococcoidia bacterium]
MTPRQEEPSIPRVRRAVGCPRCAARSLYREVTADEAVWCCLSCSWRQFSAGAAGPLPRPGRGRGHGPLHAGRLL